MSARVSPSATGAIAVRPLAMPLAPTIGSSTERPIGAVATIGLSRFSPVSVGVASGWMQVRGFRRRRSADRGFVLSDHVDWPGLLKTIQDTEAGRVIFTHGYSAVMARFMRLAKPPNESAPPRK